MHAVPSVDVEWVVAYVNEYADEPRAACDEQDDPYPDLPGTEGSPPQIAEAWASVPVAERIVLANRLYPVLAGAAEEQVAAVNALVAEVGLRPDLGVHGPEVALGWTTTSPERLLHAACALALLDWIAASGGGHRLGVCEGDRCADGYVDRSPAGMRRYCSTVCLNRAKVRAFRARQRRAR